jgi:hypothetical protein
VVRHNLNDEKKIEYPIHKGSTIQIIQLSKKENKKKVQKSNPTNSCNNESKDDKEMVNFVSKLERGTIKYKGMIPLKCFNCGGIGHFSNKSPHNNKYNDDEENSNNKKKYKKGNKRRNKNKFQNKIFYSKEDNYSLNEEDDNDSDTGDVLFMDYENSEEYFEEEGEVDIRE